MDKKGSVFKPYLLRRPSRSLSSRQKRRISHRHRLKKQWYRDLKQTKKIVKETIPEEFKNDLHRVFVKCNFNHVQMGYIIEVLRSHRCFSSLPNKSTTLLQTPRILMGQIISVPPGEYLHLGLKEALIKILNKTQPNLIPSGKIILDFNIDGCELNKK